MGRDLSRGPLTMCMRLIWFTLPYPAAAQANPWLSLPRLFGVSVWRACLCINRGWKEQQKKRARKHVFVFISPALSEEWCPATPVTLREWEMRLNKGRRDSLPRHFGTGGEYVNSGDKGESRCLRLLWEQSYCWMSQEGAREFSIKKRQQRWCDLFLSFCFISPEISTTASPHTDIHPPSSSLCPLLALELCVGWLLIGFRLHR